MKKVLDNHTLVYIIFDRPVKFKKNNSSRSVNLDSGVVYCLRKGSVVFGERYLVLHKLGTTEKKRYLDSVDELKDLLSDNPCSLYFMNKSSTELTLRKKLDLPLTITKPRFLFDGGDKVDSKYDAKYDAIEDYIYKITNYREANNRSNSFVDVRVVFPSGTKLEVTINSALAKGKSDSSGYKWGMIYIGEVNDKAVGAWVNDKYADMNSIVKEFLESSSLEIKVTPSKPVSFKSGNLGSYIEFEL